ncbi:hypothetical protein Tco_1136144 [Tanacetum coccineum]
MRFSGGVKKIVCRAKNDERSTLQAYEQLTIKSSDEDKKLFDKEMKRVNTFVDMNSEVVKGSKTRIEESSKSVGDELESDKSKKQKIDEHVESKKMMIQKRKK